MAVWFGAVNVRPLAIDVLCSFAAVNALRAVYQSLKAQICHLQTNDLICCALYVHEGFMRLMNKVGTPWEAKKEESCWYFRKQAVKNLFDNVSNPGKRELFLPEVADVWNCFCENGWELGTISWLSAAGSWKKEVHKNLHLQYSLSSHVRRNTQPDIPHILTGINQRQFLKSTFITPGK